MNNLTDNLNPLQPVNFKLVMDRSEYSNIEWFATAVNHPSVSRGPVTTNFRGEEGFVPGDKTTFGELSVTMLIDEEMVNYEEALTWLLESSSEKPKYRDMTLCILSNKKGPNKEIIFRNAFPTSLSELEFNSQATEVTYVNCTVTFRYDYFEFFREICN